jgi:hypothetical protein
VALDAAGMVFASNEDGALYAVSSGGALRDRLPLGVPGDGTYVPTALGDDGLIYAVGGGRVWVVGW